MKIFCGDLFYFYLFYFFILFFFILFLFFKKGSDTQKNFQKTITEVWLDTQQET